MTNIIFDTNAARDFVSGVKIEELEQYAKDAAAVFDKKGIKLWVSPIVIQELLYHLVDDTDKDFSISYKSIKAMMLVQEHQRKDDRHEMMSPSELLRRQGLPEMFKDIDFDEDTPVWMKAYSWSFVKMAQRGFLSFDRNAETELYFLVASPADYNEFRGDVVRMMYKLPENEFPYDSIQSVRENSKEQINFVSVIERYERKGLNG